MRQQKPMLIHNPKQKSYRISAMVHNVDHVVRIHWHNFLELEMVISGEGEQIWGSRRQSLRRGVISLINLTHYHSIIPKGDMTVLNISFDEELIPREVLVRISSAKRLFFDSLTEDEFEALETLGNLMVKECQRDKINIPYIQSLFRCIFIKLSLEPKDSEDIEESPLQIAVQYLRNHFRESPALVDIASMVGYNPEYFSALFHRKMGSTYSDYLMELKLNNARSILLNTDSNIEYIGLQCGFNSYSSFLRAFRQKHGLSPGEFRKAKIKEETVKH